MFLCHQHSACAFGRFHECGFVQRLDGVHIQDFRRDAFLVQFQGRLNSFPDQVSTCRNGDIGARHNSLDFANFERRFRLNEDWHLGPAKTEVNRTVVHGDGQRGLPCLFVIGRHDHRHVGEHLHHSDVLQDLVCGAVFSQSQPCV